jgi:uncharacterized repeat protein (TIGR01451 family)
VGHRLRARTYDLAGNERITGWQETTVDTIAPQIIISRTVTVLSPEDLFGAEAGEAEPLLLGMASDGAGIRGVTILIYAPDGQVYRETAEWDGFLWHYLPGPAMTQPGTYALRVEATDNNGNVAMAGPFAVTYGGKPTVYLPVILRAAPTTSLPSLRVTPTTPPLFLTHTAEPVQQFPGELVTYTVAFGSRDNGDATGVVVSNTLPAEVGFEATSMGAYDAGSHEVVWSGDLTGGDVYTATIVVRIDASAVPTLWMTSTARLFYGDMLPLMDTTSHRAHPFRNIHYYLPVIYSDSTGD